MGWAVGRAHVQLSRNHSLTRQECSGRVTFLTGQCRTFSAIAACIGIGVGLGRTRILNKPPLLL